MFLFDINVLYESITTITTQFGESLQSKLFSSELLLLHTSIGCQSFRTQVISYPGHFVPTLVISYLLFGHFVPSNNHFVPRSFRTRFGHFELRSTGYEMTIWWSIRTQVISYPFWSFRTAKMDGWIDELTDRQACFDWNDKLTSYS